MMLRSFLLLLILIFLKDTGHFPSPSRLVSSRERLIRPSGQIEGPAFTTGDPLILTCSSPLAVDNELTSERISQLLISTDFSFDRESKFGNTFSLSSLLILSSSKLISNEIGLRSASRVMPEILRETLENPGRLSENRGINQGQD